MLVFVCYSGPVEVRGHVGESVLSCLVEMGSFWFLSPLAVFQAYKLLASSRLHFPCHTVEAEITDVRHQIQIFLWFLEITVCEACTASAVTEPSPRVSRQA